MPTYGRGVRVLVDGREVTPARTDAAYAYVDAAAGAHTVATCPVSSCAIGGVGGTVPATLSLTLGAPASLRRLHARRADASTRRRRRPT